MKTLETPLLETQIEAHREWWAKVAKENGWYAQPFFIQVWVDDNDVIVDSISYRGLDRDLVLDY